MDLELQDKMRNFTLDFIFISFVNQNVSYGLKKSALCD